jgi:hypothetical protein
VSRLTWVRNQEIRIGFAYGTVTLCGPTFQTVQLPMLFSRVIPIAPRNPEWTRVHSVWAVPLSLATTDGIAACFLFLRVLRCFTSPGSLPAAMDSPQDAAVLPAAGFPIRTSTDQSLVGGSPWLFAATHVLHRLLEPRHPPHALSSLVTQNSDLSSNARAVPSRGRGPGPFGRRTPQRPAGRCFLTLRIWLSECPAAAPVGALGREVPGNLVELIGVEPTTSSLQSWRSTN